MNKAITLCTFLFFALFLSSCDSDDDNSTSNQQIVGTWEIFEISSSETYNLNGVEETDTSTFTTENCNPTPFFSFSENGVLTVSEISFESDEEFLCAITGQLTGTWSIISGNVYLLTVENDPAEAQITFSNQNNSVEIRIEEIDEDGELSTTFRANKI